jgi:hypothetical protein
MDRPCVSIVFAPHGLLYVYGYFLFLCLNHLQPLSLLLKRFTTDKDCNARR